MQVQGIEDEALDNVRKSLSLMRLDEDEQKTLSEARLSYLLRRVPEEVDKALQPYGYYASTVQTRIERRNQVPDVLLIIDPGAPVTVRELRIGNLNCVSPSKAWRRTMPPSARCWRLSGRVKTR